MKRFVLPQSLVARFDSNETIFLERELESIDPTDYMELYSGLLARILFPDIPGIGRLDREYTYRMWSAQGKARVKGPGARTSGKVTVTRKEVISPIRDIDVTFGWPIDDIQRAAAKGVRLEPTTVQSAMMIIARRMDEMITFGLTGTDMTGMANNANVLTSTPVTKTGGGTAWSEVATKAQIYQDLKTIINDVRVALKQAGAVDTTIPAFAKWVIALPTLYYGLADEPRSDQSDTTVLEMAMKSRYIEDIVEWNALDTADSGAYPMVMAWPRNPLFGGAVVAREYEQRNPQEVGHDISIPAIASCGGGVMRYPVAARYMVFSH
jgi:hypothetical protein